MFNKKREEEITANSNEKNLTSNITAETSKKANTILKGSKLTGNINISYDLDLSGEVEGNITSDQDSNINIKGTCNGNIKTRGGNVNIEGELINGDITAGGDVKITGKFNGGMVKAKGKLYINGEFKGKLEGNEIEVGPKAMGTGELIYNEFISVAKGADIEAHISKAHGESNTVKKTPDMRLVNLESN